MTIGAIGSGNSHVSNLEAIRRSRLVEFPEKTEPKQTTQNQAAERWNSEVGEKEEYASITFIRNSMPDLMIESRVQKYTLQDFLEGASTNPLERAAPERVTEKRATEWADESATAQTSEDLAEKEAGTGLTPAQERGVETYERMQSYSDPVVMSNAAAQFAA